MTTLAELAAQRFNVGSPAIVATGRIAASIHVDRARHDQEADLFKRAWINLVREEELAEPDDWAVEDLDFMPMSVLFTSGKDKAVRAFHDARAHGGMKLVWGESGKGGRFAWPYHAWLYASDGMLLHVPDQESVGL